MKHFIIFLSFTMLSAIGIAQTPAAKNDSIPGTNLFFENTGDIPEAADCNPSETYLKKKIKFRIAKQFEKFPQIAIDFTSFKGQDGFNDKKNPDKIVYPYEIEMYVHVKRMVVKEGKNFREYQTWKFERVYEYATMPGRKCELKFTSSNSKLVSSETVEVKN